MNRIALVAVLLMISTTAPLARADAKGRLSEEVQEAIQEFIKADSTLGPVLAKAPGYVVFAAIGKGAMGLGLAHGKGQLVEKGKVVGKTTVNQLTIGLQLGGQKYRELIVFEKAENVSEFKYGNLRLAAQASAVAAASGKAATAKFEHGMKVFTITVGGLMYEASVGGQRFSFRPY